MEVDRALRKKYKTDAHLVCYIVFRDGEPLEFQPRVNKSSIPWFYDQGFEVKMCTLFGDWDNEKHTAWNLEKFGQSLEQFATNPWLRDCGMYYSSNGCRVIRTLKEFIHVFCVEPGILHWIMSGIRAGIPLDKLCRDFTRHFRLCWVIRDGKPLCIIADLLPMTDLDIGPWCKVPLFPPHILQQYGSAGQKCIQEAGQKYGFQEYVQTNQIGRRRTPITTGFDPTIPSHWIPRVEEIAGRLQLVPLGLRHEFYLALSGTLIHRGLAYKFVPAVIRSVANAAGHNGDHHALSAEDSCHKHAEGQKITGLTTIHKKFPEVAALLEEIGIQRRHHTIDVQVKKAVLEAKETPPPSELEKVREEIYTHILYSEPGAHAIDAPCGIGKTHTVLKIAEDLVRIFSLYPSGRIRPEAKVGIVTNSNQLAIQTFEALQKRGVKAKRLFGPASLKDKEGKPVCRYLPIVQPLSEAKMSPQAHICLGNGKQPCEFLETCAAAQGWEGDEKANVVIGTYAKMAQVAEEIGKHGLLIIDEAPMVLVHHTLTLADLELALKMIDCFQNKYRDALHPLVQTFRAWLKDQEPTSFGVPLLTLIEQANHCVDPEILRRAISATQIEPSGTACLDVVECALHALEPDTSDLTPPLRSGETFKMKTHPGYAARLARAGKTLRALHETALGIRSNKPPLIRLYEVRDQITMDVVCPNHLLRSILLRQRKVVLLDASAALNLPLIQAVSGIEMQRHRFTVRDGAPIERCVLPISSASRSMWQPYGAPIWDNGILRMLQRAVDWAQQPFLFHKDQPPLITRDLFFVSYLPIYLTMSAALNPERTDVWARWANLGLRPASLEKGIERVRPILRSWPGTWLLGYFGNIRGMNHAMHCQASITFGDPRPQYGIAEHESQYLNFDLEEFVKLSAGCELEQAHGRLRAIQRTTPARMLHVGTVLPRGTGWESPILLETNPEEAARAGAMSGVEFTMLREALRWTQDQMAQILGIARRTVVRYEAGQRKIPSGTAAQVRRWAQSPSNEAPTPP